MHVPVYRVRYIRFVSRSSWLVFVLTNHGGPFDLAELQETLGMRLAQDFVFPSLLLPSRFSLKYRRLSLIEQTTDKSRTISHTVYPMYPNGGWTPFSDTTSSVLSRNAIPVGWPGNYAAASYGGVGTGSAPCGYYGSPASVRPAPFTQGKLFLGGLDSSTTKETLLKYCSKWGGITDAVVMDGRGFGFITFLDPRKAQEFLEQRTHMIDGKSVEAKAAVPKGAGSGSNLTKKLFVGGTGELSDSDFKDYFEKYGNILDAAIVRKQDGTSRGFGFVTFADELTVEKCLVVQHEIKGRKVDLRRAVPRDQMIAQQSMVMSYARPKYGPGLSNYLGYPDMAMMAYSMAPTYSVGMMMPPFVNYGPFVGGPLVKRSSSGDDHYGQY